MSDLFHQTVTFPDDGGNLVHKMRCDAAVGMSGKPCPTLKPNEKPLLYR